MRGRGRKGRMRKIRKGGGGGGGRGRGKEEGEVGILVNTDLMERILKPSLPSPSRSPYPSTSDLLKVIYFARSEFTLIQFCAELCPEIAFKKYF